MTSDKKTLKSTLDTLTSQCVRCGLCLSSCPTYQIESTEAESPRGRIALARGLANNQLSSSASLEKHIYQCLSCRTCELVCPSRVEYGKIIDLTRELIPLKKQPKIIRFLHYLVLHPHHFKTLLFLLFLYQRIGIQWLLRKSHILSLFRFARIEGFLPKLTKLKHLKTQYQPKTKKYGKIALFTGCMNPAFDQITLNDSIKLLNHLGYEVDIPPSRCCGALFLHNGERIPFDELVQENIKLYSDPSINAIIHLASGCTSTLGEYHLYHEGGNKIAEKTQDMTYFVLSHLKTHKPDISFKPLAKHVVIYTPCTMRNVRKDQNSVAELLHFIPQLKISTLTTPINCCGAAGDYFIKNAVKAEKLGCMAVSALLSENPDAILTNNIGCQLQLTKHLKKTSQTIPVMHPIRFFVDQIAFLE